MPIHKVLALFLFMLLGGCTQPFRPPPPPIDTANLSQLENLKYYNPDKVDKSKVVNPLRVESLKENSMTLGAQGALAARSEQIDAMLKKNEHYLDQAFNFNPLLLPNNVLPPVLAEGRNTFNLADNETIRIADQTYHIEKQARFVTVAPTWHDYLWMDFPKPEQPDNALLPKNPRESKVWDKYINEGWNQGLLQADSIFAENVARLKHDYVGMALYRKLVDENMISTPYVATSNLGVTGGGNNLNINDKVKRITALPELNPNAKSWKPAVAEPET